MICSCLRAQYAELDDGRRALEQLNGFELAGRPLKVGVVNDSNSAADATATQDTSKSAQITMQAGTHIPTYI